MLDIIAAFKGKKLTFGALAMGSLAFVITFELKITIYDRSNGSKILGGGEGFLRICDNFWVQNHP